MSTELRNNEYYDMQETFDWLYEKSLNKETKGLDLYNLIISENNILLAYRNIKSNTGSSTTGTDGVTIDKYKIENKKIFIEDIRERLRNYKPQSVRRIEIPKPNGKKRPLGIPTMQDRLIQQMFKQILEPVCEARFHKHSYGFRANRSAKHALARCCFVISKTENHYVVDMDIHSFFDNVNHTLLIKQLWNIGIKDNRVLAVIGKMLKAPIKGIGIPECGTPQGGILSPLISNVVLNDLDWWISNQWETFEAEHKYSYGKMPRALKTTNLKEMYIVRYADDARIFTNTYKSAVKIYHAVKGYLKNQLKLEISPEKSKITNLRKHRSEFLGFEIRVVRKRNQYVTNTFVSRKSKDKIKREIRQRVKEIQQKPTGKTIRSYNSYILGIRNYYETVSHVKQQQKKIKEASKKTTSVFRKGASATEKTLKVAFKAIAKTVTSIHNLISFGGALILLVVITLFIGIFASLSSDSGVETSTLPLSTEVIEHTETIRKYAIENDIEDYVSLLQAIMMQESGGKGNDPMQASECEYNTRYPKKPNGIQEPKYSIQVGVMYFADCLKEAKPKDSSDMQKIYLALQGYNYGKAYIPWAVTNFNGYTRANAKVYSDEMKAKLQTNVYGDPNYVNHVLQYYHVGNGDIVKVALTQVGNVGGKSYWSGYGFKSRVEWCACFVSWCANEAGLLEKGIIPKFAYCPTGIQWFKEHSQWMQKGQVPQTGYIIFFDWEGDGISDHVGIVERVEGNTVYTIEGNSDKDECRRKSYPVNSNVIVGYGMIS